MSRAQITAIALGAVYVGIECLDWYMIRSLRGQGGTLYGLSWQYVLNKCYMDIWLRNATYGYIGLGTLHNAFGVFALTNLCVNLFMEIRNQLQ